MKIPRIALCLFSLAACAGFLRADPTAKPNIIVIFMVDLGYKPGEAVPFQMMPTRHGFQEFFGSPHSNDMPDLDLIRNETLIAPHFASADEQAQLTWRYTEAALDFIQRKSADAKPFFLYYAHIMTHIPCWPSMRAAAALRAGRPSPSQPPPPAPPPPSPRPPAGRW